MAYWKRSASRYSYTSGRAKAASPRSTRRMVWPRYRATTGSSTSRQPWALCTLPGRSAHRSRSPSWLKHEEGMVAGTREVAVVRGALLRAVGRAHAAVDVEHERRPSALRLDAVDPVPGQVGQRRQILLFGHRARLEATHLARRRGVLRHPAAADHPAHCEIVPESVGVVHVFVAGEPAEHGLTELGEQRVASVLPGARVGEEISSQRRQAERVIEFPEREQAGVGSDGGAVEFELQATVESEPETLPIAFTRRTIHPPPPP